MQCPLCLSQKAVHRDTLSGASSGQAAIDDVVQVECVERCDDYRYTSTSSQQLNDVELTKRPLLSCWVSEQNQSGIVPTFTSSNITTILSSAVLTFAEKA